MNPNMKKQITSFEFRRLAMVVIKPLMSVLVVIALIASLPGLISSTVTQVTGADPTLYMQPVTDKLTKYMTTGDAGLFDLDKDAGSSDVTEAYSEEMNTALMTFMQEKGQIFIPMMLLNLLLTPALSILLTHSLISAVRREEVSLAGALRMLRYSPKALLLQLWTLVRMYAWMLPGMAVMFAGLLPVMIQPTVTAVMISLLLMLVGMVVSLVLGIRAMMHYCLAPIALAEDPSLSVNACIRASWQVMRHRKMEYFFLEISFIGWHLLSTLVLLMATLMLGMVIGSAVGMMANLLLSVYISTAQVIFYLAYTDKLGDAVEQVPADDDMLN